MSIHLYDFNKTQLKFLGVKGSDSINTVAAVIKKLSTEQTAAVLSTTKLNDAQTAATLLASGVSKADAAQILVKNKFCETEELAIELLESDSVAKMVNASSTDFLTAAWLKLKAVAKGVITTIKAHPVITAVTAAAAATAAAIGIVIAAYKKVNPSTETLAKNLDESKQKVQESTQKIEEMGNELEQVQSRIAELQAMDSLTIVEQKELNNLKETNALLTRNLELEKQKRRLENKQANKDFIKWFDSEMGYKSSIEQSAAIATSVPQPTGDPVANGIGSIAQYFLNKNKDDVYKDEIDEDNTTAKNKFKQIDELLKERKTATGERIEEIETSLKEAFDYLNNIDTELNNEMKDLDLEYTPNAKKGSQEYELNQRIVEAEEFRNKLLLKSAEYQGGFSEAYDAVLNNTLDSSRFSQAAEEIEKLKTAEDGTARKSKEFRDALYEAITEAPNGSNIKELANYLEELGMIKVAPEIGVDGITDFSNAIVEAESKTNEATKTNLLFADSFSKIASARKAFEEGLQNVETGTEDFESYAASYEEAIKLLKKGYDLDNGVLMAHVERLISDEQLEKLGYDAEQVKNYLQDHLKGVFGDKDTKQPGKGLVDKIKNEVDKNGEIHGVDEKGKDKVIASFKDNRWKFSDNENDIKQLGEKFGMTTDQILACVKALNTYNDIDLNNTDTIIGKLKEEGKVFGIEKRNRKEIKELYEPGTPDMEKSPESLAVQAFRAFWFYSHSLPETVT